MRERGVLLMRIKCAECHCVVESGFRVVACKNVATCCCTHIPLAKEASA